MAALIAALASGAEPMQSAQQNALVQKYCAVCHTDAARNGGLSLQHYDAARANPPLAAMLLSKLQNGAMGAAGAGHPDAVTGDAWTAATAAQAERAKEWSIIHANRSDANPRPFTTSVVRYVAPRKTNIKDAPLYRLTLSCDAATRKGEIQLTWSPAPQTDRTFSISLDGSAGISQRLEGKERMGNGTALQSGLASAVLNVPLPEQTLTITDLFPGESVVFPVAELDRRVRGRLAVCLSGPATH